MATVIRQGTRDELPLKVDTVTDIRRVMVTLVDATGADAPISVSGSFSVAAEYPEGSAHTTGDTGNFALGVVNDAQTALAASGQYTGFAVDTVGRQLVTGSSGMVPLLVDGSAVTQPVSIAGTVPVSIAATVAVSAASLPLPTGAATEVTLAALNAKVVAVNTGAVVLAAGSAVIGKVDQGTGGASAWKVDGSAVTQPVSIAGTVAVSGSFSSAAEYAEDSAHVSGDMGAFALGIRAEAQVQFADNDGEYSGFAVSRFGEQFVSSYSALRVEDDGGSLTVDSLQLPASLGSQLSAASLSVVLASDHATIPVSVIGTVPVSGTVAVSGVGGTVTVAGTVTANAGSGTFAVSAAALPLPSGAATEATLAAASAKLPLTLGQKAMTASLAVVVASDQSAIPVSGTVAISGTVPVSGTVAVSSVGGTVAISAAALPLPSGAATESTLSAASAKLPATLGQKTMANSLAVVLASDQSAVPVTGTFGISGSVDTELPPAAALADNAANPTAPAVGGFNMVWDGATWDRAPGTSADGTLVNLGTNNDVTVTGTVTANAGTGTFAVSAATLPLPTGAATETTLAAAAASLSVLDDWDETNRAAVNIIAGQVGVQGGAGASTALTQRVAIATDANAVSATLTASALNIGDVDVLTVPVDPFGVNADAASATGSISAKLRFIAATGIPVTALPALPTGANTIGKVDQGLGGGVSPWTVAISGSVATGASSLAKAEDALHGSGDAGVMALFVRRDTPGAAEAGDGDYCVPSTDGGGRVRITGDAGAVAVPVSLASVPSHAVTNAGIFAVQDNQVIADNAGFTDGTSKVFAAGFIFDEVAGTALTENDAAAARIDSKRAIVVGVEDLTTRGQRLAITAANAAKVDGSAVTQPVSGTVAVSSVAGTVTVTGSLASDGNTADNAAFTDGTTKVTPAGFIFDEVAGTALTENDAAAARIDSKRAQVFALEDATTRGQRAAVSAGGALKVDGSAATQPVSGTVTANAGTGTFTVSLATGTATNEVVGDVASDIAILANPLTVGGRASTATPAAVSADGDAVNNWLTRTGAQVIAGRASLAAPSSVADGDSVAAWMQRNGAAVCSLASAGVLISAGNGTESTALRVTMASDSNGSMSINGVFPGSGATHLGKLEDSSHSSGDTGVFMLAVRSDDGTANAAPTTTFANTDGEYSGFAVDRTGRQYVIAAKQSVTSTHATFTAGSQTSTPIDVSRRPMSNFTLQASGVGGTPTVWTIALQGSLDGVTYTTIFSHASSSGHIMGQSVPALGLAPYNFIQMRSGAITLSGASAITATFLGV